MKTPFKRLKLFELFKWLEPFKQYFINKAGTHDR
jgi:hypothetical protein